MLIVPVEVVMVVGFCIFGWFAITSPEPCPKKYAISGDIIKYCEFDPNQGWIKKK